MPADDLIRSGLNKGQKALSEYDSKKLLGLYGIPVTREKMCHSADEAVSELDINPMIVTPEGRLVAVDALVVLRRDVT
jgi:succinyl-CoA synthetase beta subunit